MTQALIVRAAFFLVIGCAGTAPVEPTAEPVQAERPFAESPLRSIAEDVVRVVEGERALERLAPPDTLELAWEVERAELDVIAVLLRADVRFETDWWRLTMIARGPTVQLTDAFRLEARAQTDVNELPEMHAVLGSLDASSEPVAAGGAIIAPLSTVDVPRERPSATVLVALAALCTTPTAEPRLVELALTREGERIALDVPAGRVIALEAQSQP